MANLTRRQSLGLLAAASIPSTAVVAVAAASPDIETVSERVARIGGDLADALNDYTGGKFHAVVYPSSQTSMPVSFVSSRRLSAQERFDYHLAELKKAAEELDPQIGYWSADRGTAEGLSLSVVITAFRVTGRYDGDGVYEGGTEGWSGKRGTYQVRLRDSLLDGERTFNVSTPMDRMTLKESRLRTYIGRRIGDLPEGA
ncbi:MAG: hypothetical protein LCH99_29570 [Proteobacteria bacterium]|nr:hypothetical protein [Pseudomonadota bacterium]